MTASSVDSPTGAMRAPVASSSDVTPTSLGGSPGSSSVPVSHVGSSPTPPAHHPMPPGGGNGVDGSMRAGHGAGASLVFGKPPAPSSYVTSAAPGGPVDGGASMAPGASVHMEGGAPEAGGVYSVPGEPGVGGSAAAAAAGNGER